MILTSAVMLEKFREDLYFRLDVFPIRLPTLAERIEDLPLLIDELLTRLEHTSSSSVRFTREAVVALSQYDWPGNVRELANQIERMAIKYPNGLVHPNNLPDRIKSQISEDFVPGLEINDASTVMNQVDRRCRCASTSHLRVQAEGIDLKSYISDIEVSLIQDALDKSGGVIAHAAQLLGLRRTTLAEKMRKYQIDRDPDTTPASR